MEAKGLSEKLAELLKDIDAWAVGRRSRPTHASHEIRVIEYERWQELSSTFALFLESKIPNQWTEHEKDSVRHAIEIDWAHQRLLDALQENQLEHLLVMPYPDQVIRMYMLTRGSRIENRSLRMRIALHFFEDDQSEAVKARAFEILARNKWDRTNHFATGWWESGDSLKRITSLNALQAADSELLSEYLALAVQSDDKELQLIAKSMLMLKSDGL